MGICKVEESRKLKQCTTHRRPVQSSTSEKLLTEQIPNKYKELGPIGQRTEQGLDNIKPLNKPKFKKNNKANPGLK